MRQLCLLALTLLLSGTPTGAQQETTVTPTPETYLTFPVRNALFKIAVQELKIGSFNDDQRRIVANGLAEQTLTLTPVHSYNSAVPVPPERYIASARDEQTTLFPNQIEPVLGVRHQVTSLVQQFPVIRLEVNPVPPRDYKVVINGEECPATERSEYKVLPGKVHVSVTRAPLVPCIWEGEIKYGEFKRLPCQLDPSKPAK